MLNMKALILSSNNGGGHNTVSAAIKECIEDHGGTADIRDSLSFISDAVSDMISFSHVFMYRHFPDFQSDYYTETEKKNKVFREDKALRQFIDLGRFSLGKLIQQENYDTVVCTHVFGAMMLTEAVRHYGLNIRTAIVETDYCNTPGSSNNDVALHFVPHDGLISELVSNGVPEERIVISGIPVRKHILRPMDKKIAKHLTGIPETHDHILLMGGSMGCGPIPELLQILSGRVGPETDISVICGTNIRMERDMEERFSGKENIHIFGYMPDMSWIYAASDIFVTKAGGISTTEAGITGIPTVLVNVVGACEQFNLKYFLENNAAVTGDDENELADRIEELLREPEKRRIIAENMRSLVHADAAEIIYNYIKDVQR